MRLPMSDCCCGCSCQSLPKSKNIVCPDCELEILIPHDQCQVDRVIVCTQCGAELLIIQAEPQIKIKVLEEEK